MKLIEAEKETQNIITFIKNTFRQAGFIDAVIGLSGGIDSAVSCGLIIQALGVDHVYPILMPHGGLGTSGILDAMKFIETQHIPLIHVIRIDIQPAVDMMVKIDPFMDRIRKGNIMARTRMVYLFDQAKKRNALVVGTENRSEHLLGYFTRFGDAASDIEPIQHMYKTQVYEIAKVLHIPQEIMDKAPSANLWSEQTDEGEFGFTYKEADEILYLLTEQKKSTEEIMSVGYKKELINNIQNRVKKNAFKHTTPHTMK